MRHIGLWVRLPSTVLLILPVLNCRPKMYTQIKRREGEVVYIQFLFAILSHICCINLHSSKIAILTHMPIEIKLQYCTIWQIHYLFRDTVENRNLTKILSGMLNYGQPCRTQYQVLHANHNKSNEITPN